MLVVDDKLIVSRAEDDEIKPLLNRKVVNKDHILDCVSCTFTSLIDGLRLHGRDET